MRCALCILFCCYYAHVHTRGSDTLYHPNGRISRVDTDYPFFHKLARQAREHSVYYDSTHGWITKSGDWNRQGMTGYWTSYQQGLPVRRELWRGYGPISDTFRHKDNRIESIRRYYSWRERPFRKGRCYVSTYDSSTGLLTEAGYSAIWGRQGVWHFYRNGRLISSKRYHYGFDKDSLKPSGQMRRLVYLGYGWGGGGTASPLRFEMGYTKEPYCLLFS
jgi:hypothetical protein